MAQRGESMREGTVEVNRIWFMRLLEIVDEIDLNKMTPAQSYPFMQLIGYCQSAESIIREKPQ